MTLRWEVLAAILAMAAVTYACRAGGYAAWRAARPPGFLERLLRHLPAPLFAAYCALALSRHDAWALPAAAVVVLAQWRFGSLGLSILAGVGAMAGLRALGV